MGTQRKQTDITSADSKQIGFDYQYLYFIVKLFHLCPGDEVGYEALDDIHMVSYKEGRTYFYQTKHTTATTASGEQPNLTALSEDLWKTLSNWCKLITDESDGRKKKSAQKDFIAKSIFVFVSNRKMGSNDVIDNIAKLSKTDVDGKNFLTFLKTLIAKTKDESIKKYINEVMSLGETVLVAFAKRIQFTNTQDDLFSSIREGIIDKMIRPEYVDDVLGSLYLQLKVGFFEKVKNGQHQTINYSEWIKKYQGIFEQYRTTQLPLREFTPMLPDHLENQVFVQELIEIDAIDPGDDGLSEIAELTSHYLRIKLQLDEWYQDGRITYKVLQQFHNDATLEWKNNHRLSHRSTRRDNNLDFQNALSCFDFIMTKKLALLSTDLGISMSNGEFIHLADEEKIGWKYCWKGRYYVK